MFGQLTNEEVSERAGRIRNDPDFEAALIEQLKNNRLGLFPQYTNSNLSYEDIVTPWRNLTTSVWGEAADETESWWQDMVATNDFIAETKSGSDFSFFIFSILFFMNFSSSPLLFNE